MTDRRTGLATVANGVVDAPAGYTLDSAAYVALAHHANVEAALAAKTFVVSTGIAGVAPGTTLTTTPPLTLYNPMGSGVSLALVGASMGYISGTLGAGSIVLAGNPSIVQAAPTGGTPLTPMCTYLGWAGGKALAYEGATLAAVPTLYKPVFSLGAFVGTTATAFALDQRWDGSFVLKSGTSVSLQGIAGAGTSPLVMLSLMFEEVHP